jgi:hypothetical protein
MRHVCPRHWPPPSTHPLTLPPPGTPLTTGRTCESTCGVTREKRCVSVCGHVRGGHCFIGQALTGSVISLHPTPTPTPTLTPTPTPTQNTHPPPGRALHRQRYKCPTCEYATSDQSVLTIHQRQHSGLKPFLCQYCPFMAPKKSDVTVHERRHTGDRPYVCHVCPYRAPCKKDLDRHLTTHMVPGDTVEDAGPYVGRGGCCACGEEVGGEGEGEGEGAPLVRPPPYSFLPPYGVQSHRRAVGGWVDWLPGHGWDA